MITVNASQLYVQQIDRNFIIALINIRQVPTSKLSITRIYLALWGKNSFGISQISSSSVGLIIEFTYEINI